MYTVLVSPPTEPVHAIAASTRAYDGLAVVAAVAVVVLAVAVAGAADFGAGVGSAVAVAG